MYSIKNQPYTDYKFTIMLATSMEIRKELLWTEEFREPATVYSALS